MNNASLFKYEVVHINIRGVRSNKKNLECYLAEMNFPEVVCLNETKLPRNKTFELNGYNISARREHSDIGGSRGSMILTRRDIMNVIEIEETKELFHEEIIGIHIQKSNSSPDVKIFTYYNPPLSAPCEAIFGYISSLQEICILTGDINCKNTIWGSSRDETRGVELLETLNKNDLILFNNDSKTRCDPVTGKEESLDLVIGNIDSTRLFQEFWVGFDVGSDHYPLHAVFQFKAPENGASLSGKIRRVQKLNRTKWNRILTDLPVISRAETATQLDINAMKITENINHAFEQSCPLTNTKKRPKCAFTPEIEAKVKEKRRLRREKNEATRSGDDILVREIMTRINKLGNEIKKLQKVEQKKVLERHCHKLNKEQNPKKFFETFDKIAQPILNAEPPVSIQRPIEDEFGNRASTNQEKSILFANRLQNIHQEPDFVGFDQSWKLTVENFINENNDIYVTKPNETYSQEEDGDDSALCQEVTLDEFDLNLAKCKNRSAVGHDGISYCLLKKLPPETKKQLCLIFSDAIRIGYFPKTWKIAQVKMVPKPNKDTKFAKSFRPISLLSCIGKLLERILARRLSTYLEDNKLFSKSQSGFRTHHMTTEQLLRLSEEAHIGFKNHMSTAALFLDAEAAFDRCWHNGIRYKLKKNLNLPNRIIRLLSSFLTGRSLQVVYEGCFSHVVHLKAGTPQGSPLSPLIYIIFVNDYPTSMEENCSLSQFADDTSLWTTTYFQSTAIRRLQTALNALEGWCRKWRVKLNGEKSNLIFISRNGKKEDENHALHLFNDIIRPVNSAKFLGIEIDSHLSFKKHFDNVVNKSCKRLNVLKVLSYNGTKPEIMIKLYKTYVRSIIEYGSIAFIAAPSLQIERLQRIQNEAIRTCLRLPHYIRIQLLHEYASMMPVKDRFVSFNTKLLNTMKTHNTHIESLVTNHSAVIEKPVSPLDIILSHPQS